MTGWDPADHPRDPRNGQFTDKLKLAGRINLGGGAKLLGSSKIRTDGNYTNSVTLAHLKTPDGRVSTRLGVVDNEHTGSWRGADRGATVELDSTARDQLRSTLQEAAEAGKQHRAQAKADMAEYDRLADRQGTLSTQEQQRLEELGAKLPPEDTFFRDRIPTDWGDVVLEATGIDDEDGGWFLDMYVRHRSSYVEDGRFQEGPFAGDFTEEHAASLGSSQIRQLRQALDVSSGWAEQLSSRMGGR